MRLLPLLILLAGCAAPMASGKEADELARELEGRVVGEPTSCIPIRQTTSLTVVDARTLAYRTGQTTWINRLDSDCPGMRPLTTLIVEAHGSQYCRGDRVRTQDPGTTIPGPICVLGDFTPYRLPS
jgi:hypothetical protein